MAERREGSEAVRQRQRVRVGQAVRVWVAAGSLPGSSGFYSARSARERGSRVGQPSSSSSCRPRLRRRRPLAFPPSQRPPEPEQEMHIHKVTTRAALVLIRATEAHLVLVPHRVHPSSSRSSPRRRRTCSRAPSSSRPCSAAGPARATSSTPTSAARPPSACTSAWPSPSVLPPVLCESLS